MQQLTDDRVSGDQAVTTDVHISDELVLAIGVRVVVGVAVLEHGESELGPVQVFTQPVALLHV